MPNISTSSHAFSGLPLWEHFIKATHYQPTHQQMVIAHTQWAIPMLDHFIDAFPKYTLHNLQHQINIVRLISQLLGDQMQKLTGLEAAMLILAAVYHDIGMVFYPHQLAAVSKEADFLKFLQAHPDARLQFEESNKIASKNLIEWYCRWTHAKRVWQFLDDAEQSTGEMLEWDDLPIKMQLGDLCESHNSSADYIRKSDTNKFPIDFHGDSDMVFCSILLRLADILDFDDSRTPKSVYEFLQLDKVQSSTDAISDEEWQKHLSSRGFILKLENGRPKLLYQAAPKNIKVEISIRKFIKIISNELDACNRLLRFCSDQWRAFLLPAEINLDGLKSQGYRYGDYHFTLAEDKVMDLLIGDGIYNDEYVFLRELLQNALDTSRHRQFREQAINKEYKAKSIEVSYFSDADGYQWIRVDDFGMGMNLDIIERHLLKKGESYYNSALFKLEKLLIKEQQQTDFEPISRFGIGLLSCFIVGDRVEISTTHLDEPDNAYRLSIENRDGYFMLQSKQDRDPALPLPSKSGPQKGFRDHPGTSIAVRITTNKEYQGFNLKARLSQYLLAPPIPVVFEGEMIGGDFDDLLLKPWAINQSFEVNHEFVRDVANLTGLKFSNGIQVNLMMLSLTDNSLTSKLKGQISIISIKAEPDEVVPDRQTSDTLRLESGHESLKIVFTKEIEEKDKKRSENVTADLSYILNRISIPKEITHDRLFPHESRYSEELRISHNGIRIPQNENSIRLNDNIISCIPFMTNVIDLNRTFVARGIIYFQDELLPDLTISRNEIKKLSFKIAGHLATASRQLEQLRTSSLDSIFAYYKYSDHNIDVTRKIIEESGLYEQHREFWNNEIRLETIGGELNIADLLNKIEQPTSYYRRNYRSTFYRALVDYVLESNFDLTCGIVDVFDEPYWEHYINKKSNPLLKAADNFAPGLFTKFLNETHLIIYKNDINLDHPYIQWYLKAYPLLKDKFDYYGQQLIYMLFNRTYRRGQQYEEINKILDRLRTILPLEFRPPLELKLTKQDFHGKLGSNWNY